MNKVLLSVALALGLCGSGCFSQSTDKNDIRFVDVDRILTQSKTARVRDSHIEAVNQSLKADLEKLMQAMARAPEAERRRADQMGISVMDRVLAKETAAAEKIMRDGIREAVNRYVNKNPGHIIVDGNRFKKYRDIPHLCIVKGDGKYMSIAAASVLAKTHRDEYMENLHALFPVYNWKKNKGYPTQEHRKGIEQAGVTEFHRISFTLLDPQLKIQF